jgi:hypothetical protein
MTRIEFEPAAGDGRPADGGPPRLSLDHCRAAQRHVTPAQPLIAGILGQSGLRDRD